MFERFFVLSIGHRTYANVVSMIGRDPSFPAPIAEFWSPGFWNCDQNMLLNIDLFCNQELGSFWQNRTLSNFSPSHIFNRSCNLSEFLRGPAAPGVRVTLVAVQRRQAL
jgi:hypothetical protein